MVDSEEGSDINMQTFNSIRLSKGSSKNVVPAAIEQKQDNIVFELNEKQNNH